MAAVQNSDGTNNFAGYTVVTRNGTVAEPYSWSVQCVEREAAVGIEVTKTHLLLAALRIRTLTACVSLTVPSLQILEDDGDVVGHSVKIKIRFSTTAAAITT